MVPPLVVVVHRGQAGVTEGGAAGIECFHVLCKEAIKQSLNKTYRDELKDSPKVVRNFSRVLPGCCLAKQIQLLTHLCMCHNFIYRDEV